MSHPSVRLDNPHEATTRTPRARTRAPPMPSKRPSPSAMEADGATASPTPSPSPPGSRMRSSRARFRLDDRRPEPSPSPSPRDSYSRKSDRKRRRRAPPESAAVTAPSERRPRALQDSASPSARRPRAFQFQEAAALAVLAAGAPRGSRSYGAVQRLWSDADELALLAGAAAFRARNGHVPRLPDMGALYDHLRGSLSPHLDQAKVYYKLKRLKSKFQHVAPSAAAGQHELRVRDLCTKVWGAHFGLPAEDDAPEEEEASERRTAPDAAAMLPVATEVLDAYWKTSGLSGASLEKGLSQLGPKTARSIETRWRQQLDAEVRSQMRRHDLAKDVYSLLIDAIKGLGP